MKTDKQTNKTKQKRVSVCCGVGVRKSEIEGYGYICLNCNMPTKTTFIILNGIGEKKMKIRNAIIEFNETKSQTVNVHITQLINEGIIRTVTFSQTYREE